MTSKGRTVPPHGRPIPSHPMMHPDPFGQGIHGRSVVGPNPFDMVPPLDIMEQKIAAQHAEMQILVKENRRLAASHLSLRQQLAAAQQELQGFQRHVEAVKADHNQQIMSLMETMSKMEADLKAAETVKVELKQAHAEAQKLAGVRQELISRVQKLTHELQTIHTDVQKVPALRSELETATQEFQHLRANFDYERKLRMDHYESLQSMEKNYVYMVREVEKLRAELSKVTALDKSVHVVGSSYAPNTMQKNDTSIHHSVTQNPYEDNHGRSLARPAASVSGLPAVTAQTQPGYPSRGNTYDALMVAVTQPGYPSRGNTMVANHDASKFGFASNGGFDMPSTNVVASAPTSAPAAGVSAPNHVSNQRLEHSGPAAALTTPYGSTAAAPLAYYGQTSALYSSIPAASSSYGLAPALSTYGMVPAQSTYVTAQPQSTYGSAQAQQLQPYQSAQGPSPYCNAVKPP